MEEDYRVIFEFFGRKEMKIVKASSREEAEKKVKDSIKFWEVEQSKAPPSPEVFKKLLEEMSDSFNIKVAISKLPMTSLLLLHDIFHHDKECCGLHRGNELDRMIDMRALKEAKLLDENGELSPLGIKLMNIVYNDH
jgi:uncharacterized Zn finger protein